MKLTTRQINLALREARSRLSNHSQDARVQAFVDLADLVAQFLEADDDRAAARQSLEANRAAATVPLSDARLALREAVRP